MSTSIESGIRTLADALSAQIARDIAAKQLERDTVAAILREVTRPHSEPMPVLLVRREPPAEPYPHPAVLKYVPRALRGIACAIDERRHQFVLGIDHEAEPAFSVAANLIDTLGYGQLVRADRPGPGALGFGIHYIGPQ